MNYNTALVQLPLVRETEKQRIVTPENVRQACADIANLAQECFQVLCLNTRHILVNRHMVTLGLLDSALVHPREVFRPAIEDSAAPQEKARQPEMLLSAKDLQIQEYDDALTARIIEKITVRSRNEIEIRFIGGYEKAMPLE